MAKKQWQWQKIATQTKKHCDSTSLGRKRSSKITNKYNLYVWLYDYEYILLFTKPIIYPSNKKLRDICLWTCFCWILSLWGTGVRLQGTWKSIPAQQLVAKRGRAGGSWRGTMKNRGPRFFWLIFRWGGLSWLIETWVPNRILICLDNSWQIHLLVLTLIYTIPRMFESRANMNQVWFSIFPTSGISYMVWAAW